jgi:hypothetical protein
MGCRLARGSVNGEAQVTYYISWGQIGIVQTAAAVLASTHIGDFLRFFSQFAADLSHAVAMLFGNACSILQIWFDSLPETW